MHTPAVQVNDPRVPFETLGAKLSAVPFRTGLPQASRNEMVTVVVWPPIRTESATTMVLRRASGVLAITRTGSRSAPAAAMVPSVVAKVASSALTSTEGTTVATPFAKVTSAVVRTAIAAMVGAVPIGASEAPEKVSRLVPV